LLLIPRGFLARLRAEPDFARHAAVDASLADERRTLAKLVLTVAEQEKEIHPVGADGEPAKDVFDLLDEKVIGELYSEYPGHAEAHAAFEEAIVSGRMKRRDRKEFWRTEFGAPIDLESCTRIAKRMRERDRRPHELATVVEDCERLSLELR
jgi:hypothetical protein